ncbi:MAG: transposase [Labilithrix sp.]|nr:transposase [Labilithrix sp.]
MYAYIGRPSVPPERLLEATLLMALYAVRSERQFCEQLDHNLLFRWFFDMDMVEESFVPTVFTTNRDRLLAHDVAGEFVRAVTAQVDVREADEPRALHADGTLIDSWASLERFKRMATTTRRRRRTRATRPSTRTARSEATTRTGRTPIPTRGSRGRAAGKGVPGGRRVTLGADEGYDTGAFVAACRARNVTPHVAQNVTKRRGSMIDARTAEHSGYAVAQRVRKRVEELFG